MPDHTRIFTDYFNRQFWGNASGSSGPNSAYELTPVLRQNLQQLLHDYQIKHIVDAGCGDANLIRYLDLTGITYIGVECVADLTTLNQQRFTDQPNMSFQTLDIVTEILPDTQLVICRDVVHYLPNELLWQFLENLLKSPFKYLLVTHNTHAPLSANTTTDVGIFRPVNLSQAPFHLPEPLTTIKEDVFAKEMALWSRTAIEEALKKHA